MTMTMTMTIMTIISSSVFERPVSSAHNSGHAPMAKLNSGEHHHQQQQQRHQQQHHHHYNCECDYFHDINTILKS